MPKPAVVVDMEFIKSEAEMKAQPFPTTVMLEVDIRMKIAVVLNPDHFHIYFIGR